MNIPETVASYWRYCMARGEKPRKVWLVVSLGNIQPKGYVMGWCINKRWALRQAEELFDRTGTLTELVWCPPPRMP